MIRNASLNVVIEISVYVLCWFNLYMKHIDTNSESWVDFTVAVAILVGSTFPNGVDGDESGYIISLY